MTRTDPDEGRDDAEPPEALQIDVANQQSEHPIDARALQRAVAAVLSDSPYRTAEISVAVVDAAAMHELNRRFLNHDYETDVLSFALESDADRLAGEIVVCADVAAQNAAEAGWPIAHELLLYVVHGALHLIGHDDQQPDAAQQMRSAELSMLELLGIARSPVDSRWSSKAMPTTGQSRGSISL